MTPVRSRGPQQPSRQLRPSRQPDNGLLSGGSLRDGPLGSGRLFCSGTFNGGFPSRGDLRGNSFVSSSLPISSLLGCSYLGSGRLSSRFLRSSRPGFLGSSSSSGLPSSGHLLGVDLSEGPFAPHPMRCCPVPERLTSTTRGCRTEAHSSTRARAHTHTHTREGRLPPRPERSHGPITSTARKHGPTRRTPSCLNFLFLFHA